MYSLILIVAKVTLRLASLEIQVRWVRDRFSCDSECSSGPYAENRSLDGDLKYGPELQCLSHRQDGRVRLIVY